MLNTTSLSIILRQYKEGNLSEEEVIQLINDIRDNSPIYPIWPQITYDNNPNFPEYKITC